MSNQLDNQLEDDQKSTKGFETNYQTRRDAPTSSNDEPKEEHMNAVQSSTLERVLGGEEHHIEAEPLADAAEMLKVSTRSRPSAVAGAIAGVIREHGIAEVQSIGAGATNQAIKAVAIARSYLRDDGIDITCVPSFIDIDIDNQERTAIRLLIERR